MEGSNPEDTSAEAPQAPHADASLAKHTQGVYERQARRFDAERPKSLLEREWVDRFLALVEPEGRILDLGCGSGDPIAGYMTNQGFEVVGVDASEAMLEIARNRFPTGAWRRADMRRLDLPESFDGIISWDSFFHLMPDEQRSVLRRIARHMNEGAALMLTVGPEAGEVGGWVGGEPVYHASLAPSEYEMLLRELGVEVLEFVPEDPTCDYHTILLARKGRDMSDFPTSGTIWALFLGAAAAGPATALLHEFDVVSLGPVASLWPLFVIVLAAALGIFLGLRIGRQDFRWLRWLAMIPNGLVLCFYSFFLLFFGLGGSR